MIFLFIRQIRRKQLLYRTIRDCSRVNFSERDMRLSVHGSSGIRRVKLSSSSANVFWCPIGWQLARRAEGMARIGETGCLSTSRASSLATTETEHRESVPKHGAKLQPPAHSGSASAPARKEQTPRAPPERHERNFTRSKRRSTG